MDFKYTLGQTVTLKRNGQRGVVTARQETFLGTTYFVSYKNADGTTSYIWHTESALGECGIVDLPSSKRTEERDETTIKTAVFEAALDGLRTGNLHNPAAAMVDLIKVAKQLLLESGE